MSLELLDRDVICVPGSEYEQQVAQALGERLKQITIKQMSDFTAHIEDFLSKYAHTCPPVYTVHGKTIYKYQPEPLKGFEWTSVLFSAGEDEDGEFIVLERFKWG